MAAKVITAVLVLCIILTATVEPCAADMFLEGYMKCFHECHDDCTKGGMGDTYCEMKCDEDCTTKESLAKLDKAKEDIDAINKGAGTVPTTEVEQ